jgi:integrase
VASLHKDPRGKSPYFYCAYTLPDGRRAFRSTKQTERKKAWAECLRLEKAADLARKGQLTEIQARKILDEILDSIGEGPIRSESVDEFFNAWLTSNRLARKTSTARRYQKAIEEFLDSLPETKREKPLASITPTDIAQFRDKRTAQGVSQSTVKLDMKLVRGVLSAARRQGLILHNPAEAIDLPDSQSSNSREVFTASEVGELIRVAAPDWHTAILLAYFTGARLGDIASLTWESVDFSGGFIAYRQYKTGGRVEVPIHQELEEHLLARAGDSPAGYLCPALGKVKISGRRGLSRQFADIMMKAGIDQKQVNSSKNRRFSAKSFHSLRHSFASALANAGISADVRMKLTGHKSLGVHQRYSHIEFAPLKQAIKSLPRIVNGALP